MKLRPLIIDDAAKAEIRRVREHAEANPVSTKDLMRSIANPDLAVGNTPAFVCVIPVGYLCVFSHEQQPIGLCRHLSVSVLGDGAAPNELAVEELMTDFGFTCKLRDALKVWTEPVNAVKVAVNVLEQLKP